MRGVGASEQGALARQAQLVLPQIAHQEKAAPSSAQAHQAVALLLVGSFFRRQPGAQQLQQLAVGEPGEQLPQQGASPFLGKGRHDEAWTRRIESDARLHELYCVLAERWSLDCAVVFWAQ